MPAAELRLHLIQAKESPLQLALDARHWDVVSLLIKECDATTEDIDLSVTDKVTPLIL